MIQKAICRLAGKGMVLGGVLMLSGCLGSGDESTASASGPAAPTALVVEPLSEALVLSWTGVTGATGYRIHWSEQSDVDADSTSMEVETPWYAHTNLTPGTPYYYRVAAISGEGEGALSAQASGVPLAASGPSDKAP